ncbi:DUF1338 domain-containing protein [Pseudidiomarina gelatinasegens]|jgi:hypothetical protein|uniref:2-oxoadipate dioxygenase/decarboxylase n=1 Tax=Pseudidiomarina gelatinasegens TaxID=2487740 RepID=A0A443Z611_9GAMM|nr:DUF1338 domain-containing protein [Pseudidiomarina gelatinasegens]RWU12203.1 DUF1338 domain-containing protein [Pseudidiomarina gelatinasegens]|tara:strand:- start:2385 stop:3209 length:825 start_codon:yes stop_codon:yes gene_type:complete
MSHSVEQFFDNLWNDYVQLTPSAAKVHQVLGQGRSIINDHVAFRTFNIAPVRLAALAKHFEDMGYKACGDYVFEAKKLVAKHYEHSNPRLPKIFISELLVEEFSPELQRIVNALVAQVDAQSVAKPEFLYSGAHWQISSTDYEQLLEESEYAAWMAAFGFRANHFTVNVNELPDFESLEQVNATLKEAGFQLNTSGGEIKGSREVFLEQSSTMADHTAVRFSDMEKVIPSCFYEFAKRYEIAPDQLYTGFVAASADKIFESTNARTQKEQDGNA